MPVTLPADATICISCTLPYQPAAPDLAQRVSQLKDRQLFALGQAEGRASDLGKLVQVRSRETSEVRVLCWIVCAGCLTHYEKVTQ